MLSTSSSKVSGAFPFSIFRGTLRFWFALNVIIAIVTLCVHFFALNVDQSSTLALTSLRKELERKCQPDSIDKFLAAETARGLAEPSALARLLASNTPPASLFAIHVWVEEAALLPAVHTRLRTVNDRLVASAPPSLMQSRRQYSQQILLHRLVRFDPPPTDLWLTPATQGTEPLASPSPQPGTLLGDAASEPVDESAHAAPAPSPSFAAPLSAFTGLEHARHLLSQRARDQQLGLATLHHAFAPDPNAQLQTISVSLIRLPAALHASFLGWLEAPNGSEVERVQAVARLMNKSTTEDRHHFYGTRCESFDAHQFYCVLPPHVSTPSSSSERPSSSGSRHARMMSRRAVEVALTSVLAADMHIESFRDTNFMHLFFAIREQAGCVHAYRSVVALQQSMKDYPDMKVPHSVHPMLDQLRQLVHHDQFVLAAGAADALQYHPLLTPQLYIPFDHNVVSHVLIFLPVFSFVLLCVRFGRDMYLKDRKARMKPRAAATTATKLDTKTASAPLVTMPPPLSTPNTSRRKAKREQ